jgi:hypothetical protein
MQQSPLEPHIADLAPTDAILTGYHEAHLVTHFALA